jgi:hypothetical protein
MAGRAEAVTSNPALTPANEVWWYAHVIAVKIDSVRWRGTPVTDLMPSPKERLKRYQRHAVESYAAARACNDPREQETYLRIAESWNRLALALEDHMKRHGDADS